MSPALPDSGEEVGVGDEVAAGDPDGFAVGAGEIRDVAYGAGAPMFAPLLQAARLRAITARTTGERRSENISAFPI